MHRPSEKSALIWTCQVSRVICQKKANLAERHLRNYTFEIYSSANAPRLNFKLLFDGSTVAQKGHAAATFIHNLVTLPNHIFISCQQTTLKVSNFADFKAMFPAVSMKFRNWSISRSRVIKTA